MAGPKLIERNNTLGETTVLEARLAGQLLASHSIQQPQAVVRQLGAMQAQHFDMAKWAVASRLQLATPMAQTQGRKQNQNQEKNEADHGVAPAACATIHTIHAAIESGEIVRTHVLRPTWHFVAGEDLLWMVQLSAPAIKGALFSRDKKIGILEKEYVRSDAAIQKILEENSALDRQGLVTALSEKGFKMDAYRSNHYIMHAELNGIICSGPAVKNKHTYALAKRMLGNQYQRAVNLKVQLQGEAAAGELARRYFSTRGPATLQDFAWWSGLGMTVIKKVITTLGKNIEIIPNGDINFYQIPAANTTAVKGKEGSGVKLLSAFDEYLISYKDRSAMLNAQYNGQIITSNGLFRPALIDDGSVIGCWAVETGKSGKKGCRISILPFKRLKGANNKRLLALAGVQAERYCSFRDEPLAELVMGQEFVG